MSNPCFKRGSRQFFNNTVLLSCFEMGLVVTVQGSWGIANSKIVVILRSDGAVCASEGVIGNTQSLGFWELTKTILRGSCTPYHVPLKETKVSCYL